MANEKSLMQKYRFKKTNNGFAFESRYYAERFINDVLMNVCVNFSIKFEVVKIVDWFYIYEVRRVVIDEDYISV